MYVEGPPLLYISYINPEQTKQDQYQETLEAARDKDQCIKNVLKKRMRVIKWKEVFRRKVFSMEFWCLLLNSLNRRHLLEQAFVIPLKCSHHVHKTHIVLKSSPLMFKCAWSNGVIEKKMKSGNRKEHGTRFIYRLVVSYEYGKGQKEIGCTAVDGVQMNDLERGVN